MLPVGWILNRERTLTEPSSRIRAIPQRPATAIGVDHLGSAQPFFKNDAGCITVKVPALELAPAVVFNGV